MNAKNHRGAPSAAYEHNRRAWDGYARTERRFAEPAGDGDFVQPLYALDGMAWLESDIAGKRILCLAAGGGKQGPLCAAAGAEVTVVDISGEMLELDRRVAAERGLLLRTIQTSMDDLSMLQEGEFDMVIQPVSTCYVPDVTSVYRQVARVSSVGALYISQHKQPASLQAEAKPSSLGYALALPYYRHGPLPPAEGTVHREEGTLEYLHRWEQLLGGMCRAGFVIEDLMEPMHADCHAAPGRFAHRSRYVAPYVRVKARRVGRRRQVRTLWMP